MTSCLAMADYYVRHFKKPLELSYVGIDNAVPMLAKAREFAGWADLFTMRHAPEFLSNWVSCDINSLSKRVTENGTIVFNFSYFFGQAGLRSDDIKTLATFVREVMTVCRAKDLFVIYVNNRLDDFHQNFLLFRNELGWESVNSRDCHFLSYQRRAPKELGAFITSFGVEKFRYVVVKMRLVDKSRNSVQ